MLKVHINEIDITNKGNKLKLLHNIFFSLKPGQIISLIGENGAGKSTLLKSIAGLLKNRDFHTSGRVELNGLDLLNISEEELNEIRRKNIRFVFQDPITAFDPLKKFGYYFNLFPGKRSKIAEHLKELAIPDVREVEQIYASQVSSGMAQRISIAIAFGTGAKLILLDEPTSAVDVHTANTIASFLVKNIRGKSASAIIVTQDIYFARAVSDKIFRIEAGTIKKFNLEEISGN